MTIDYGIHIGITSASIAKMETGEPVILKSDTLKDSIPVCVAFSKKGEVLVGDAAYRHHVVNKHRALIQGTNSFIEFTRTIGTSKSYYSSNIDKSFTSKELLAEVIKKLLSFEKTQNVYTAVITIPAAFKANQVDATKKAAKIAGLSQVEIVQEPVAAAMTYGLGSMKKDDFWLVFYFGGGTFDAALLKVEDRIMKVTDSEGDNYLGGKNLDLAIVDEIILPYLKENYSLDSVLNNDAEKQKLRNAMKFIAEGAKNILSSKKEFNIYVEPGDIGEDDDGEEIEIDIDLSQKDMETVLSPVFQKAIDLCKTLLKRNNLKGSSLNSLILVGGPTFSPVLREMLEEQITKPDTSVDPMAVVSNGAALYASTVKLSDEVTEQTRDKSKIQIEIGHASSTVEVEEFVTIKILKDKTEGEIPEKVFAEIIRSDKAWSSSKIEINELGEVIETQLNEGKTNNFEVVLSDDKGNILESEPKEFTIIQGIGVLDSMQWLTLNWGTEVKRQYDGKTVFKQIHGLEKFKSLPAVGTYNGLKTKKQIRLGMKEDFIKIPLYQGEHDADGTRAIYNEHVYDIIISGADLPALLPENSDVDLTINIDKSQKVTIQAYFPYLDYTTEIDVTSDTVQTIDSKWLSNEFRKAKGNIQELKVKGDNSVKIQKAESDITELEEKFRNNKEDIDTKQEVLTNLRRVLKTIDELEGQTEWSNLEKKLKEQFYKLEKANEYLGYKKTTKDINQLRNQLEDVIKTKDVKIGNALLEEIVGYIDKTSITYSTLEDYLFNLTEQEIIDAPTFQKYFDIIFEMKNNPSSDGIRRVYAELKGYEK